MMQLSALARLAVLSLGRVRTRDRESVYRVSRGTDLVNRESLHNISWYPLVPQRESLDPYVYPYTHGLMHVSRERTPISPRGLLINRRAKYSH